MAIAENANSRNYECLLQYYNTYKYDKAYIREPPSSTRLNYSVNNSLNYNLESRIYYQQKMFGVDNFSLDSIGNFVDYFGPNVFTLWKAALLRKRIMLRNVASIETSCKYGKLAKILS